MNEKNILKLSIGITLGLGMTAIILPIIVFPYAETTKDPDAIEFIVWFISVGLFLLAILFIPITIGAWFFSKNQSNKSLSISEYTYKDG